MSYLFDGCQNTPTRGSWTSPQALSPQALSLQALSSQALSSQTPSQQVLISHPSHQPEVGSGLCCQPVSSASTPPSA